MTSSARAPAMYLARASRDLTWLSAVGAPIAFLIASGTPAGSERPYDSANHVLSG